MIIAILLALLVVTVADLAPPIPVLTPTPGYILGAGSRNSKVVLEAFLETNCPDSGKAWAELTKLAAHYTTGDVAIILHQVPLPYHRNSMICTQAVRCIEDMVPSKVKDFITSIYDNNLFLSNMLTYYLDDDEVLNLVANIAVQTAGVDKETFKEEVINHRPYVVYAWKYATRRGVAGAPWYAINGVDVVGDSSTLITKDEWVKYIDELLE